jgi:hypothetical protein
MDAPPKAPSIERCGYTIICGYTTIGGCTTICGYNIL